jgi:hypothetical protein
MWLAGQQDLLGCQQGAVWVQGDGAGSAFDHTLGWYRFGSQHC